MRKFYNHQFQEFATTPIQLRLFLPISDIFTFISHWRHSKDFRDIISDVLLTLEQLRFRDIYTRRYSCLLRGCRRVLTRWWNLPKILILQQWIRNILRLPLLWLGYRVSKRGLRDALKLVIAWKVLRWHWRRLVRFLILNQRPVIRFIWHVEKLVEVVRISFLILLVFVINLYLILILKLVWLILIKRIINICHHLILVNIVHVVKPLSRKPAHIRSLPIVSLSRWGEGRLWYSCLSIDLHRSPTSCILVRLTIINRLPGDGFSTLAAIPFLLAWILVWKASTTCW